MSKKKHLSKGQSAPPRSSAAAELASAASPYLPAAHPPTRNITWLTVSMILFVAWFLFLLMAAISS